MCLFERRDSNQRGGNAPVVTGLFTLSLHFAIRQNAFNAWYFFIKLNFVLGKKKKNTNDDS